MNWDADNYATWADWKTNSSQDAHSVNADPLFVSPATGDFHLQAASPAIDSGVNLGSPYNLGLSPGSSWPSSVTTADQDNHGSGWEIGAYVFLNPHAVAVASVGNGPIFQGSASSLPNYTPPRQQTVYPDGRVVYLDDTSTGSTNSPQKDSEQAHTFTRNLSYKMTGTDVKQLQQFLNTHGFILSTSGAGSPGKETTLFGLLTYKSLKAYQKSVGLPSTGYFGVMTRGVVMKK
jgi:hypothetical protein